MILIRRQRPFTLQTPLNGALHRGSAIANNLFQSLTLSVVACQVRPHSACHVDGALSLASCYCGTWGHEPRQNLKFLDFLPLTL